MLFHVVIVWQKKKTISFFQLKHQTSTEEVWLAINEDGVAIINYQSLVSGAGLIIDYDLIVLMGRLELDLKLMIALAWPSHVTSAINCIIIIIILFITYFLFKIFIITYENLSYKIKYR